MTWKRLIEKCLSVVAIVAVLYVLVTVAFVVASSVYLGLQRKIGSADSLDAALVTQIMVLAACVIFALRVIILLIILVVVIKKIRARGGVMNTLRGLPVEWLLAMLLLLSTEWFFFSVLYMSYFVFFV